VVGVLTTHAHRDHWGALADVLAATGAPHLAGEVDADDIAVPTDVRLADGDTVRFGDVVLDVIHLRGHTPGSIALVYDDPEGPPHLFTGDCLFPGSVGNAETPSASRRCTPTCRKLFARCPTRQVYRPARTRRSAPAPHLEWHDRGW
jgi:glyoxylase-like metal-dependent hydrolase (beta-lactamase superfamily II)